MTLPFWRLGGAVLILTLAASIAGAATTKETPCTGGGGEIRLEFAIDEVRSAKGTIAVAVYGERAEDFLAKGKKVGKLRIPAQAGAVRGCIALPRAGTYAVAAYHDEDGDRHLTRNLVGLPTEGVAVSNDPEMVLGIPTFDAAAFAITASTARIHMKMHYR